MTTRTFARVQLIDVDQRAGFADYEMPVEDGTSMGELFRDLRREFGRCTSKVYVDKKDGGAQHVGWHFEARVPYDDEPRTTFLREAWITLYDREVTYHELGA